MERIFLKSFYVAGFSYYEGAFVFEKMKIGSMLKLRYEPNNKFDPYAVEIYFDERKIGYIPRNSNRDVSIILQAGYDIFDAVVQQLSPEEHPEQQIKVGLFIKSKNKNVSAE